MSSPFHWITDFFRPAAARPLIQDPARVARKYRFWRYSVYISLLLGYSFFYTTRLSFAVAKKPLIDAGVLDVEQLGDLGFALLITYAVGKFVNGFLADRVHLGRFFATGLLGSAIINVVFGFTHFFWLFLLLWALNGWLQSVGTPTSGVAMAMWFSNRERGTRYSVWSTAHNLGEAMSFSLTALLVAGMGNDWRWAFWGPGFVCVVLGILLFYTMADRPAGLGLPPIAEFKNDHIGVTNDDHVPIRELQLEVLRNGRVWILAVSSALLYVARYGINHWGVLYLQIEKSYDLVTAGFVVSIFPIVGIAGTALSGAISDKFFGSRRSPVTLVYGVIFVISLYGFYFGPAGHPVIAIASAAGAGFALGGLLVFLGGLTAMDITSKRAIGAALGLVGGCSYVGAAIQDRVSGMLLERTHRVVDGMDVYDFTAAKYVWIGAAFLSIVLAMTLWNSEAAAKAAKERRT